MNCLESVARLHLYLDRELTAEELTIVQQHLEDCPSCDCRFHVDMSIKRLIHERCTIERAPEHLREAVYRLARQVVDIPLTFDPEVAMEIRADIEATE